MIRSISPYYITTPFVSANTSLTCTSYTLSIFIWDGLKASVPATASIEQTKNNPTGSTGNDKVNIANLIQDYLEFTPQSASVTSVIDGNNQYWVQTSVTYITTNSADATTAQEVFTSLYGLGYSTGIEGENVVTVPNNLLISQDYFKINKSGAFVVPILLDESVTKTGSIISYPDNNINITISEAATTTSSELVKYIWIKTSEAGSDTYIDVVYDGTTVRLMVTNELKYTPYDVVFQNKLGAEQIITFFKERTDSISIKKTSFESDRGQASAGNHQFVTTSVQARADFKLNTGFIEEENNEMIKQLLMSERVWLHDGTNMIPLEVGKLSQEWKTQLKQKLINYEIDFKYAYNEINNT
tara:strand:+ start:603 stop:1673 length:1071 start_codon:yes stop_codon:yes gene_type:complete